MAGSASSFQDFQYRPSLSPRGKVVLYVDDAGVYRKQINGDVAFIRTVILDENREIVRDLMDRISILVSARKGESSPAAAEKVPTSEPTLEKSTSTIDLTEAGTAGAEYTPGLDD